MKYEKAKKLQKHLRDSMSKNNTTVALSYDGPWQAKPKANANYSVEVLLHGHLIAEICGPIKGRQKLIIPTWHGYGTVTTRQRVNRVLQTLKAKGNMYQKDHVNYFNGVEFFSLTCHTVQISLDKALGHCAACRGNGKFYRYTKELGSYTETCPACKGKGYTRS